MFELAGEQSPDLRGRMLWGGVQGKSRKALARTVFFDRLGAMHDRTYEDQQRRASGLNRIIAALGCATGCISNVTTMRQQGITIPEEYLQHLSLLYAVRWEDQAL